ncbi:hypothetical protein BC332_07836 [Capsicum chinense]|nr:hypothetical protein BC332_07836 [Capsicum chinense]
MYLNPKLGGAGVGGSGLISKDKYYYGFFNAALKLPAHFKFEVVVAFYNIGVHYDKWNLGVLSPVTLSSLNVGSRDLAKKRSYKVGLKGESLSLHTLSGSSSVEWVQGPFSIGMQMKMFLLDLSLLGLMLNILMNEVCVMEHPRLLTVAGPVRIVNDALSVEYADRGWHWKRSPTDLGDWTELVTDETDLDSAYAYLSEQLLDTP